MDLNNPVIKLCAAGTQAEFAGKKDNACELYHQAWEAASDDFEACVAAHYMARCQESPEETIRWNQEALDRANAVKDDRVKDFYPSLYLNMGVRSSCLETKPKRRNTLTWLLNWVFRIKWIKKSDLK